jgi:Eco57I restriction-modification methylase
VMRDRGGFDVVIGNPPYVRYRAPRDADPLRGFRTRPAGNLYAMVVERALELLRSGGRLGMIVPIASVSTEGMAPLQALYTGHPQWHSHFATRPAKLFPGVDMNLTITLLEKRTDEALVFSTTYHRWRSADPAERASLFQQLAYVRVPPDVRRPPNPYPKIGSVAEVELLRRLLAHGHALGEYMTADGTAIYYHSGGRYWRKALPVRLSSHYKELRVPARLAPVVGCLLSSQLFYWWWIVNSNCMDVVAREVVGLPVFDLDGTDTGKFAALWSRLQAALREGAATRRRRGARIATDEVNFDVARCKPIIDEIDRALATGYGFSAAQLDFVVSYDLRFRMGGAG